MTTEKTMTTREAAQEIRRFMAASKSAVKCGETWSAEMELHHAEAKRALEVLANAAAVGDVG